MSIASDLRAYADDAREQGKKVVDSVVEQARTQARDAQAQLNDVTGQANDLVGKLTDTAKENVAGLRKSATATANDLRAQAEKTLDLSAVRNAVEPYVAQARGYAETVSATITEQAEKVLATARKDKRVATLLDSAESVTGAVIETVQERVVQPVRHLIGSAPKRPANKSGARSATKRTAPKPATAKPASKPAAKATAKASGTSTARKSSATKASSATKTASRSRSTATKATPKA